MKSIRMMTVCVGATVALAAAPAAASTLRITVTNLAATDGFALTPVYSALHDGGFDAFTEGQAASAGVELLAELGDPSGMPAERNAAVSGSTAVVVFGGAPGMPRPIFGGETASAEIAITDPVSQRFFTFLSMVVPTNDTFIGNDDPMAFEIFDASGQFLGPRAFTVTGAHVFDAGAEVNDPLDGPAFAAGVDATLGVTENGVVTPGFFDLALFAGVTTVPGFTIDPALAGVIANTTDPSDFALAQISIDRVDVAPIPLPAAAWMLLAGLAAMGGVARRRD